MRNEFSGALNFRRHNSRAVKFYVQYLVHEANFVFDHVILQLFTPQINLINFHLVTSHPSVIHIGNNASLENSQYFLLLPNRLLTAYHDGKLLETI